MLVVFQEEEEILMLALEYSYKMQLPPLLLQWEENKGMIKLILYLELINLELMIKLMSLMIKVDKMG